MTVDQYHISIGNATHVGKVRDHNEDYMAHFDTPFGYCIVVCDGMGGHAAGEIASQNAVTAIRHFLREEASRNADVPNALNNAVEFANYRLREMIKDDISLKGMGTTCAILLMHKNGCYTAHAGDSRVYLIRDQHITRLTKDHSTVQRMIDMGVLTEKEAEESEKKNEISKAIGIFEKVEASITSAPLGLQAGDKLILCSDGLTTHLKDETILRIVHAQKDVQQAALSLVEQANEHGGTDNITVQVVHYTGHPETRKKFTGRKRVAIIASMTIVLILAAIYYFKPGYSNDSVSQPSVEEPAKIKQAREKDRQK